MPTDDGFVLGVDLDGVCGDHTAAFRSFVARKWDIEPGSLASQTTWTFTEWGLDDEEFERLHREAVLDDRMFRTMPMVPGCAEALWRLSDAGVWIRLITHRLYLNWGHAVAVGDTVAWLDDHGIPYRDLCFLGQKPQVEADIYVDDAPHNVAALRATGAEVIVFDQPYNREVPGPRAITWTEVERKVVDAMAAAGRAVQRPLPLPDDAAARLHGRMTASDRATHDDE